MSSPLASAGHRLPSRPRLLVGLLLALATFPSAAGASDDENLPEARKHWQRGKALHEARRFRAAIAEYKQAFRLVRHPNVLLSIARAYRELGFTGDDPRADTEQAMRYFVLFLEAQPGDYERDKIEKQIVECAARLGRSPPRLPPRPSAVAESDRGQAEGQDATPEVVTRPPEKPASPAVPTGAPPPQPSDRPPGRLGLRVGLGVAIAVGALAAGYGAYALAEDGTPACHPATASARCPSVVDGVVPGAIALGAGGALAVASVIALVVTEQKARASAAHEVTLAPLAGAGGVGLAVRGAF